MQSQHKLLDDHIYLVLAELDWLPCSQAMSKIQTLTSCVQYLVGHLTHFIMRYSAVRVRSLKVFLEQIAAELLLVRLP